MKKTTVKEIYRNYESFIGEEVEILGWVKKIRDQKKLHL